MLIHRHMEAILREMAASFPVVTITGPRQSGKTTLAKMAFPRKEYVSLENPDMRMFAQTDPRGFLVPVTICGLDRKMGQNWSGKIVRNNETHEIHENFN